VIEEIIYGIVDRVTFNNPENGWSVLLRKNMLHVFEEDIVELDLVYAIIIHKSQGSEFEIVIIPVLTQHYKVLFLNLIHRITPGQEDRFFCRYKKALAMAVKKQDTSQRQTALKELIITN
jgi:exodeoxyribonuclease V alpha subunit